MVRKPTIKDVAQQAGVSIATVSFVLNRNPKQAISEPVRRRVLQAARDLNYHPSAIAAGLASRRTGNIAIVFFHNDQMISNQYYSFVLEGAIREAAKRGYNLFFAYMEEEYRTASALPKVVREGNTDGVIVIKEISPGMVQDIEARGIPVVVVDHFPQMTDVHSVDIDNYRGGQIAVEHLIGMGHRHITCIHAHPERPSIRGRLDGFKDALKSQGLSVSMRRIFTECGDLSFGSGYEKAQRLLTAKQRPTAFFCVNDEMAAGAVRAAHHLGLHVPGDLSVIGFDNITMSNYTDPAITSIGADKASLGSRAVIQLTRIIAKKREHRVHEVLPVELVIRESTGPISTGPVNESVIGRPHFRR